MSCCKGSNSAVADASVRETPADLANGDDGFAGSFTSTSSINYKVVIPMSEYNPVITHFTPAAFPIPAHLDRRIIDSCRRCWKEIYYGVNGDRQNFCLIFYDRILKKSPRFADVFPAGEKGVLFKHDLLGKAINMVVALELETCRTRLTALGKYHNKLKIRPWMYSDYFVTIVETLCEVLGNKATYAVMEQWYQIFSFVSYFMLKGALAGNTIEGEVGVGSFVGPFEGDSRVALSRVAKLTESS
jgi:hemoglobin-like flavoprotein